MGDPAPRQDLGDQPGRFSLGSEKRVTTGLSSLLGLPSEKLCTPGCFLCHGASLRHTAVAPASQAGRQQRRVEDTVAKPDSNPLLLGLNPMGCYIKRPLRARSVASVVSDSL